MLKVWDWSSGTEARASGGRGRVIRVMTLPETESAPPNLCSKVLVD